MLRETRIGSVTIRIVEGNIVEARTDAIVNAANSLSFKPMDGGVSGALRRACAKGAAKDAVVVDAIKRWWDSKGIEHKGKKIPVTQAGVQPAAGALLEQGVAHIVHAVGPCWTDFPLSTNKDKLAAMFEKVSKLIQRTVRRALRAACRVGARSVTIPSVSGGIFTHMRASSSVKTREQKAARRAACEAVFSWAQLYAKRAEGEKDEILVDLIDLPARQRGQIGMFVAAFDEVSKEISSSEAVEAQIGEATT